MDRMKALAWFAFAVMLLWGIVLLNIAQADEVKKPDDPNIIRKTMDIPYLEPEFDATAKQIGDVVYFPIWSYISGNDTLALWKTVQVAKHKKLSKLVIYINSGGGSAFDGLGVCDVILAAQKDGFEVTTEANGLVASAAVPIFAVAQKRISSPGTIFMIHEASLFKFISDEKKSDLVAQTKMIELLEGRYNQLISSRSKLTIEELKAKCKETTWFTAEQAKEWGLVDEIK
jgi:ATP-dependent protease ClpP protease subunit